MIPKESIFYCPICKAKLFRMEGSLKCMCGHSFDVSRQGYVNLLKSNSSGRHGDDKLMVEARKNFLNKGFYAKLRYAISDIIGEGHLLLDSGCGEGYYTSLFAEKNSVCGIDISKEALKAAATRCKNCEFAVASIGEIPLPDKSVDTIVNVFAPDSPTEFSRILTENGRLIAVYPMEGHLFELKAAVYDKPYHNPAVNTQREDMNIVSQKEVKYRIELKSNEDIVSLFKMTPYYYKTSREDQQKLERLDSLEVNLEFLIIQYQKK